MSGRRGMLLAAGICIPVGLAAWFFYAGALRCAPAQDFMVFHLAAQSGLDGAFSLIADGDAFTAQLNARYGDWLCRPLEPHPWLYPPFFLLMVLPLGLLTLPVAYGLFLSVTFAVLLLAMRCHAPTIGRWAFCATALALSPASAFTVAVGQNGFLTSGLMVGGIGLIGRSPLGAGVLLGLLACKPQLWLMVPVALIAAREWRVLAAAVTMICVLALASLMALGAEPWRAWLELMTKPSPLYDEWLRFGRMNGQSAYAVAALAGAPVGVARVLQAGMTLGCAGVVWWCFRVSGAAGIARSAMRTDMRLAVLLTATILAAPHVSNYDAVMLAVAVLLVVLRLLDEGFRPRDILLVVAVWNIELLNPPAMFRLGLVTPLVLGLFLAALCTKRWRLAPRLAAAVPA